MAALLALRWTPGQELRREEPLREVVDAAVALAAGDRQDAGLAQRLQDRADLVGGAPVPVDGRTRLNVRGAQRAALADPLQQLLDQWGMLVEGTSRVALVVEVPRQPVPGQLRGGHQRQHLVVRLVQDAIAVQEVIGPVPPITRDAGEERQVVVAAGDLEGVELERAEAVHHAHDRGWLRGERARRGEQMPHDEEAAGGRGGDVAGLLDHPRMVGDPGARDAGRGPARTGCTSARGAGQRAP